MEYLYAFSQGLINVFQWPAIGFLFLAVFIGLWIGAVPGIGGFTGLILLLPFTYRMEPVSAFALLLGMFAVTSTSDTLSSVLLGIPGTAASQATLLDGHTLARKGQASRALGAAFTVSAFGGVVGGLLMAASLPLIRPFILSFGEPEFFMLTLWGLTMVGSLSGRSVTKGLAMCCLGLLVAMIGYGESDSYPRYYFGVDYLLNHIPVVSMIMGLFAISELIDLAITGRTISQVPADQSNSSMMDGVKDACKNWRLAIRCSAIGVYIGMLPGLGQSVVDWVAYGHAVQSTKDNPKFGQGDIRGVIAPEAANNAHRGGALMPTIAFGIPGDATMAIIIGALMIQGIRPGPEMLTTHLSLTFSLVWTIIIANILAAGALMVWSRQLCKIAFIQGHVIVPGVMLFVIMGAWLGTQSFGDWIVMIFFGVLGYFMKVSGWSRPPLVIALVLGPVMENSYHISNRMADNFSWLTRPVCIGLIFLIVLTLYFSIRGIIKSGSKIGLDVGTGEGYVHNPALSVLLSALLILIFGFGFVVATSFPTSSMVFPLVICILGIILGVVLLVKDIKMIRIEKEAQGIGLRSYFRQGAEKSLLIPSLRFLLAIILTVVAALVVGHKIAIPAFIGFYVFFWAKYKLYWAMLYAGIGFAIIHLFYDKLLHFFLLPPVFLSWFGWG